MLPFYDDAVDEIAVQQLTAGVGCLIAYAFKVVLYGIVYVDAFQAGNQLLFVVGYGETGQEIL